MTATDLTAEEAQDLAWKKLGAILAEEDGAFVVYKMVSEADVGSATSAQPTTRMRKVEIGRGETRRDALASAGAK